MSETDILGDKTAKLLHDILTEIVLDKKAIIVQAVNYSAMMTIGIRSNPTDQGRIVGTRGGHFKSLSALCNCIGAKQKITIELLPIGKKTEAKDRYYPFVAKDNWREEEIRALIVRTVQAVALCEEAVAIEQQAEQMGVSKFVIHVARQERPELVASMTTGMVNPNGMVTGWLKILVNAIGKANGRTIILEILADKDGDLPQPETSAGRFARELPQ